MRWDAVERELVILSQCHIRTANAFRALADELRRERVSGTDNLYEGGVSRGESKNKTGPEGLADPAQSELF